MIIACVWVDFSAEKCKSRKMCSAAPGGSLAQRPSSSEKSGFYPQIIEQAQTAPADAQEIYQIG